MPYLAYDINKKGAISVIFRYLLCLHPVAAMVFFAIFVYIFIHVFSSESDISTLTLLLPLIKAARHQGASENGD
jgi:hypothetical protein